MSKKIIILGNDNFVGPDADNIHAIGSEGQFWTGADNDKTYIRNKQLQLSDTLIETTTLMSAPVKDRYVVKTASFDTELAYDTYHGDCTSNDITCTLVDTGIKYTIIRADASIDYSLTIVGSVGDTINGEASFVLHSQHDTVTISWDGTEWHLISFVSGLVRTLQTNYVSGTGTAGADNTAQNVYTIVLPANTLTRNGDRIRVRAYWKGDTGNAVTATIKLNTVTISTTKDSGAATFQVNEAWLHYIDQTHANIIAMAGGVLDTTISNNNVAGFDFQVDQNIVISQNAAVNNHIVVYFLAADIFER